MSSLSLDRETGAPRETASRAAVELIDPRAIAADLEKLATTHAGGERELRTALAQLLKAALVAGRAKAEQ